MKCSLLAIGWLAVLAIAHPYIQPRLITRTDQSGSSSMRSPRGEQSQARVSTTDPITRSAAAVKVKIKAQGPTNIWSKGAEDLKFDTVEPGIESSLKAHHNLYAEAGGSAPGPPPPRASVRRPGGLVYTEQDPKDHALKGSVTARKAHASIRTPTGESGYIETVHADGTVGQELIGGGKSHSISLYGPGQGRSKIKASVTKGGILSVSGSAADEDR